MKKLQFKLVGKEMLTKEQMKNIKGGDSPCGEMPQDNIICDENRNNSECINNCVCGTTNVGSEELEIYECIPPGGGGGELA